VQPINAEEVLPIRQANKSNVNFTKVERTSQQAVQGLQTFLSAFSLISFSC
jgi:hypothetical protein